MQVREDEQEIIETARERERKGEPLNAAEQARLTGFYQQIEAAEAIYLAPATERLRQQREELELCVNRLETLRTEIRLCLSRIESLVREMPPTNH